MEQPEITRRGALDCQACVPTDFTDEQVIAFTEAANPCGTTHGWQIVREGSKYLGGDRERVPCDGRSGFVHIMLEA